MDIETADFILEALDFALEGVDFVIEGVDLAIEGVDFSIEGIDLVIEGVDFVIEVSDLLPGALAVAPEAPDFVFAASGLATEASARSSAALHDAPAHCAPFSLVSSVIPPYLTTSPFHLS